MIEEKKYLQVYILRDRFFTAMRFCDENNCRKASTIGGTVILCDAANSCAKRSVSSNKRILMGIFCPGPNSTLMDTMTGFSADGGGATSLGGAMGISCL